LTEKMHRCPSSATNDHMALAQEPIEKFDGHIATMRSFLSYIITMMETFPIVMTKLEANQRQDIGEPCVVPWANFVKELYGRPDLYVGPPNPLPVDPHCSGWALSDHIKERLGRNTPFFDFVNAPFTHPLGTRISLICINYSWDAYDTFVKELLGFLKRNCIGEPRIKLIIEKERTEKVKGTAFPTNQKLKMLAILPEDEEVAEGVRRNYELQASLKSEQVQLTLKVAKELRTAFAHRFSHPSNELIEIIRSSPFEDFPIRLTDDGYEVTLELSRRIAEVIQVMAHLINQKAVQNYAAHFNPPQ
jgi:hypothetical protein